MNLRNTLELSLGLLELNEKNVNSVEPKSRTKISWLIPWAAMTMFDPVKVLSM